RRAKASAPVAVNVATAELRQIVAMVDVAADYSTAKPARLGRAGILDDRVDQRGALVGMARADDVRAIGWNDPVILGVEAMRAFLDVPAVVAALIHPVHLFPEPLPDVGD